jgi:hypothetical protein
MGESYDASYSACDATKAIVEYYRPGESPKHWTRMLALRLNVAGPNSFQQVETMGESIRADGKGAVATYKHDDGYGIDFILTTRRHPALDTFRYVVPFPLPTSSPYQEFDAFRYVDRANGAGSVSIQFAEIIPHEDLVRMMETSTLVTYYQGLRVEVVGALWSVSMPTIEKVPPNTALEPTPTAP